MHKRFVNNCTIELSLIPQGAILIKSGQEDINPSKPKMEFVQTYHQGKKSIYLPG
ncbi:MAG: CRISPR-associated protein, partial [Rivularia sp. ALOHA_DT_140]|nr:CRISPR-associated protein [Rivularia sp. ALOHA_DT_140]